MINSTRLLASIDLKGALPEGRFTPNEILDLAYDCLIGDVQPLIIGVREEYFVRKESVAIQAGLAKYAIPSRAAGSKLREIKLIQNSQVINLPQIGVEEITRNYQGQPSTFYLESNGVVLYPTPSSTQDTLDLSYFLRVSRPVTSTEVAVVTNIALGVVTASCPSTWSVADSFDVMNRNGEIILMDAVSTSVTATDITFADASSLSVGDYVSLAGESFLIQIPDEAVPLLAMLTVVECMNSLGDLQALQVAQGKAEQLRASLTNLLTARVLGEPRRFSPQI